METLPNEVLEKVLAFINDEKTLYACRRVNRRWNQVAVRQWRLIHSYPVSILTEHMMNEFLTDMDFRLQDFPFSKFRFINLNPENLLAAKQILETHANYIRNLDFQMLSLTLGDMIPELLDFLRHLNMLPNLEELRVGSMMRELEIADAINLTLPNLRCLRLPTTLPSHPIAKSLLNAAPNLEELETIVLVTTPELQWRLPEECKAIRTIDIHLRVKMLITATTTAVTTLSRYLTDEWRNVRVKSLTIAVGTDHPNLVPELKRNIQMVLDTHGDHIKIFKFFIWPSSFQSQLTLPVMPQLEKLELSCHGNRELVAPILGNPFANLKSVCLWSLNEPTNILRGAVLGTVEEFKLSFSGAHGGVEEFTHWENVFPNLKTFRLDQTDSYANALGYLEFIVSHMRMDSLETLEYRLGLGNPGLSAVNQEKHRVKINRIFSGLDNLEEIMERWNSGEKGEEADAEEDFWAPIESQRGPCLVNMSGLKNFYLDYPIDDEFAIAVLLRMKPLDLITICAKKLSLRVFCQVIARHGSYCSTKSPVRSEI